MDTTKTTTHIGLCAGYGGIELGLKRIIPNLRSVALCEIEAFACANLVAKMEAGLMEPAPIWTDLKSFPWESFRDRVDILTGGYPCQPFSAAGKRLGTEDPRHLWPYIASGIRILRPKLCYFENVEGHISLGLREVIGELESIGYTASWGIFSAREVGAPHQRKRVFILAYDKSLGIQGCGAGWLQESRPHAGQGLSVCGGNAGCRELANASGNGHNRRELQDRVEGWTSGELPQPHAGEPCGVWSEASGCGQAWPSRPGEPQHGWEPPRVVGNATESRLQISGGQRSSMGESRAKQESQRSDEAMGNTQQFLLPASREHGAMDETSGIPADGEGCEPSQTDPESSATRKREGDGGNASECSETQPPMGRDADGPADRVDYAELQVSCDNRTDELRLLGNGVVPATAERAFRTLLEELNT